MLPINNPPKACGPRINPTNIGATIGSKAGNIISINKRLDFSEEEATLCSALHSDPFDSTQPRDELAPQATPRADGADSDAPALPARRVRFAAQLEEDPPAALHSPRLARTHAARMLRAVSRSLARALRCAPG